MTDDEFRERYINRLADLLVEREHWDRELAIREAADEYKKCPRVELADEWQDDPESTANESYVETYAGPHDHDEEDDDDWDDGEDGWYDEDEEVY